MFEQQELNIGAARLVADCFCLLRLPAEELAYEVRWFFTRLRGEQTTSPVVSVDRFGVATKPNRNSSSDVSIERKDANTYVLNIFGTQDR